MATLTDVVTGEKTAKWSADPQVRHTSSWVLSAPAKPWAHERPAGQLRPGVVYRLKAWSTDQATSTAEVYFRLEDLKPLQPGNIRVQDIDANASYSYSAPTEKKAQAHNDAFKVVSLATFSADCGDNPRMTD